MSSIWISTIPRTRSREVGCQSDLSAIQVSSHSPSNTRDFDGSTYAPRALVDFDVGQKELGITLGPEPALLSLRVIWLAIDDAVPPALDVS